MRTRQYLVLCVAVILSSISSGFGRKVTPSSHGCNCVEDPMSAARLGGIKTGCMYNIDGNVTIDSYTDRNSGIYAPNNRLAERQSQTSVFVESKRESIAFQGYRGSVTHYYHFLFGALVPFVEFHLNLMYRGQKWLKWESVSATQLTTHDTTYNIATDLGPMKRLLFELPVIFVEKFDADLKDMLFERVKMRPSLLAEGALPQYLTCITPSSMSAQAVNETQTENKNLTLNISSIYVLPSYDIHYQDMYDKYREMHVTPQLRRRVLAYLDATMPPYILDLPTYDVLLVQRSYDPTYNVGGIIHVVPTKRAPGSKGGRTGQDRRNISNHAELHVAVRDRLKTTPFSLSNVVLDRSGLYYQYHLFRNAKVVIAQHGAALANIFFMRSRNSRDQGSTPSAASNSSSSISNVRSSSRTDTGTSESNDRGSSPVSLTKGGYDACVIEISPQYGRENFIFRNLALAWGVGYESVEQATEMGVVDVAAVIAAFNRTIVKCLSV